MPGRKAAGGDSKKKHKKANADGQADAQVVVAASTPQAATTAGNAYGKPTALQAHPAASSASPLAQRVPNLYWGAIDMQQLVSNSRAEAAAAACTATSRFVCAVDLRNGAPAAAGPQALRFVQQGGDAWRAAHAGVLSSGLLPEALGLREASAAKALGQASRAGHSYLLLAAQHLQEGLTQHRRSAEAQAAPGHASDAQAHGDEHRAHAQALAELADALLAARMGSHASTSTCSKAAAPCGSQPAEPSAAAAAAAQQRAGSTSGHEAAGADQGAGPSAGEEQRRAHSIAAAKEGLGEVRLAWGLVQEPPSLDLLLRLLPPSSSLHEVGMCRVPPSALPHPYAFFDHNSSGGAAGPQQPHPQLLLPPLASSPDALAMHVVRLPARQAAQLLQLGVGPKAGTSAGAGVGSSAGTGAGAGAGAGPGTAQASPAVAHEQAVSTSQHGHDQAMAVLKEVLLRLPIHADLHPSYTPAAAAGADQENEQAAQGSGEATAGDASWPLEQQGEEQGSGGEAQSDDGDEVAAGGGCGEDERAGDEAPVGLAPCSASSAELQAVLLQALQSAAVLGAVLTSHGPCFSLAAAAADAPAKRPAAAPAPAPAPAGCDVSDRGSSSCSTAGMVEVAIREVVEIKNSCPFGIKEVRHGARGKVRREWVVCDPGVRGGGIPPHWVPQLQLHMLAAGCWSALLIHRSATRGARLYRLYRDEVYIRAMLRILSRLYCDFVLPGRTPPPDALYSPDPVAYRSFLGHTQRLGRGAVCVAHLSTTPLAEGADPRPYLV